MSPASVPDEVARNICLSEGWALLGSIGGGSFKRVFRVQKSKREIFALKIVAEASPRTSREVTALRRCNHTNIARLFSVGRHNHQGTSYDYTLEEFLAGGTLTSRLDGNGLLNDEQVLNLGESIIGAIIHLADLELVHRDIKPDNIMFKEDAVTPVLVDFGLVRDLADVSLTQTWAPRGPGTPYFSAPEQLNNQKHLIDWRTDQFSLGVVLCFARFGFHPFRNDTEPEFSRSVVERVAARGSRNGRILGLIRTSGLICIDQMTRTWPVERFLTKEQLIRAWRAQRN